MTAKLFREPTLNVMWKGQNGLASLLRSVDIVRAVGNVENLEDENDSRHRLKRPLTSDDAKTLLLYSSRIVTMSLVAVRSVSERLSELQTAPLGTLFPRLKLLCSIATSTSSDAMFVLNCAGQDLRQFDHSSSTSFSPALLNILSQTTPRLTSLKLVAAPPRLELEDDEFVIPRTDHTHLRAVLHQMPELRALHLMTDIDDGLWKTISELPVLEDLKVGSWLQLPFPVNCHALQQVTTFSHLQSLSVFTIDPEYALPSLQAMVFPDIRTIRFIFQIPDNRGCAALFKAIHTCSPTALLTGLRVAIGDIHYQPALNCIIDKASIAPFLLLSQLSHVVLHTPQWILSLDDSDIQDMARAWPNLHTLELKTDYSAHSVFVGSEDQYERPPVITLLGLAPLGSHCPNLSVLTVDICDVTESDVTGGLSGLVDSEPASATGFVATPTQNASLVMISVGRAKVAGAAIPIVATALSKMFTSLMYVHSEQDRDGWREVARRIARANLEMFLRPG
ncbi:hypothetical protein BXZ70DRAFT_1013235 [Cristinia sonorae]|uniref:F-box domain-containing protein n=1 Tax=Cristinia sonorae TaxID=1940300 RepID=A0A8K0XJI5_9AGAR|nr:hypothetical protein BXZ70DRAFT_1013235 [Cristinia sonorae]